MADHGMNPPATEEPHFSLVVLCYRSGKSVIPHVDRLHRMLSSLRQSWEIVLVGNFKEGSQDETPEVVKELACRLPHVRALTLPKRGMMGWDMRMGLNEARGRYIGVIDGDGQFPFESIFACLFKIEVEDLDMVKTYRVRRGDGLYRNVISKVYNLIFNVLFGVHEKDVNSKPKILDREKYRQLDLHSDDWFTDAEMMIRAHEMGFRIGEVPIHFAANSDRDSFVTPQSIWEFLLNLFRYRFGKRRR
jgi:glycosyltransferase involved in cell wall biosynthesis